MCLGQGAHRISESVKPKEEKLGILVVSVTASNLESVMNIVGQNKLTKSPTVKLEKPVGDTTKFMILFQDYEASEVVALKKWIERLDLVSGVTSTVKRGFVSVETKAKLIKTGKVMLGAFGTSLVALTGKDFTGGKAVDLSTLTVNALISAVISGILAGTAYLAKE